MSIINEYHYQWVSMSPSMSIMVIINQKLCTEGLTLTADVLETGSQWQLLTSSDFQAAKLALDPSKNNTALFTGRNKIYWPPANSKEQTDRRYLSMKNSIVSLSKSTTTSRLATTFSPETSTSISTDPTMLTPNKSVTPHKSTTSNRWSMPQKSTISNSWSITQLINRATHKNGSLSMSHAILSPTSWSMINLREYKGIPFSVKITKLTKKPRIRKMLHHNIVQLSHQHQFLWYWGSIEIMVIWICCSLCLDL